MTELGQTERADLNAQRLAVAADELECEVRRARFRAQLALRLDGEDALNGAVFR